MNFRPFQGLSCYNEMEHYYFDFIHIKIIKAWIEFDIISDKDGTQIFGCLKSCEKLRNITWN